VKKVETLDLEGGTQLLIARKFGEPGARPKAYLQAGLHADELPGMLALNYLAKSLEDAAARGEIIGEIILVPAANPIGLAQRDASYIAGRFDAATGENFNRGFQVLAPAVAKKAGEKLGADADDNIAIIRKAMGKALRKIEPETPVAALRHQLMSLAYDADIVLDLHADNEALLHLYTGPALWPDAMDLAAELDARTVLLAEDSGDGCFDEAFSGPWWALAKEFPNAAIPPACLAATIELRSSNDVDADHADRDARALLRFLMRRGVIAGEPGALPRLLCEATPLSAMQQLKSDVEGLITYRARLGDSVREGDIVADVTPVLGEPVEICAVTDGILFARHDQPYAWKGKVFGKIAGAKPLPGGGMLSP
jgi:predicted deacylase